MFNKKLKQELLEYKKLYSQKNVEITELRNKLSEKEREIKRLEEFNKKIDAKIEELCKPKINDFCLSIIDSGRVVSTGVFESSINVLNKSYKDLEELFESQAKELSYLRERDEDNKKILFLSAKVEQLLNKLNKK